MKAIGADVIRVDACNGQAQAAAEGAQLTLFAYDDNKKEESRERLPELQLFGLVWISALHLCRSGDAADKSAWEHGLLLAQCQNRVRRLADIPCNQLTPTLFAAEIEAMYAGRPGTRVHVHDEDWARQKGMGAFLSVNAGSATPAKFVETHIDCERAPADKAPIVLIGKGVCFDT